MKWTFRPVPKMPENLRPLTLNPITLKLLLQRGFFSKEEIERFFNATYEDLHNPTDLSGAKEAIERFEKSLEKKESVVIFGDYDADGITSTLVLKEALQLVGLEPNTYIPDRNKEGYGLNSAALDFLKKEYDPDLLVTVDCGISNRKEILYARKLDMDVIVIDHHSIPKTLPQGAILINPKLPDQKYPFQELAGVGVVFKVASALWKKAMPGKIEQLKWLLDLVAIGTIADCVPLLEENRIFAKFGLIVLQKTKRLGLQEIIKTARLNVGDASPPKSEMISFQIGPRLNAAGRMDHADITLNLLSEKDPVKARVLALELEKKNSQRQKITEEIYREIKANMDEKTEHKLIIKKGEHWPLGVLGVVAGKLSEEYHCPAFVLREENHIIEGSGRSIEHFNLIESVSESERLLESFGGHAQAMGIKIKPHNFPQFEKNLRKIAEKSYDKKTWGKSIHIDLSIGPEQIDWDLLSEIKKFAPFGEGNREPIFAAENMLIEESRLVGNGGKHLKLRLSAKKIPAKNFEGIFFNADEKFYQLKKNESVSIAFKLKSNEFNGNHKIELHIIDIRKDS